MAFNSEIKGYMTFGKSFSRGGAFPLEAYEIWTDYDALVAYAANTDPAKDPSYIGQKVAYVDLENNKVTHYGIEIDGTLKELGASPIGDEKSIVIGENNTISLKGIEGLVFERDILGEDGQPTGQKENVQFQPLMTKDGLIWVEPSKTTVEGLASLIDGLTARVSALENDRVTEQELADAIAGVEAKIPTNNNELENGAGYQTADDVSSAITTGIANKADKAATLSGYGITDAYTKTEVDTELAKKANQTDLEALEGRVDAFLTGTGTEDALDSLKELIDYIKTHDDVDINGILASIQGLTDKLAGIDGTVKAYVDGAVEALKIGDYAKAADLATLAGRVDALENKPFDTYATKSEVEAVDAKFSGVVSNDTFEQFKTSTEGTLAEKVDAGTIAHTSEGVTEGVTREGTSLNIVIDAPTRAETAQMIADKIKDIAGEESIPAVKADLDAEIERSTAKDNSHDAALATLQGAATVVGSVAEAKALAQKGVDDAAIATGIANQNKSDLTALLANFNNIVTKEQTGLVAKVSALEAKDLELAGLISGIDSTVKANAATIGEHTAAITALEGKDAELAGLISGVDKKFENYSDTAAMNKAIDDKIAAIPAVDLAPYLKKTEAEATYATITGLEAIYKAGEGELPATGVLADEIARAMAAENKLAEDLALLIENPTEALDSVKEIIAHVQSNGTAVAGIITRLDGHDASIQKNIADITSINNALAALIQPKASDEISVAEDGTLGINAVSTDKLVQGEQTLVLDGGTSVA